MNCLMMNELWIVLSQWMMAMMEEKANHNPYTSQERAQGQ
jgi:hypothetical protein